MSVNFDEKDLKETPAGEDDDQNFIKKDEAQKAETKSEVKEDEELKGVIWKLKNLVFPKNNQIRDLDNEVGGLEVEEAKESSEADVWDGRSDEVDKMATNVFNSSGMRSVVWKKKREKLEAAKHGLAAASAVGTKSKNKATVSDGIIATPTEGYVARLKNLKLDRSGPNDDGMGR